MTDPAYEAAQSRDPVETAYTQDNPETRGAPPAVTCPHCHAPVDSMSVECGYVATYPGAVAYPGGTFGDGHTVGAGERPPVIRGVVPKTSPAPDHDVVTVGPCGCVLVWQDARDIQAAFTRSHAQAEHAKAVAARCGPDRRRPH